MGHPQSSAIFNLVHFWRLPKQPWPLIRFLHESRNSHRRLLLSVNVLSHTFRLDWCVPDTRKGRDKYTAIGFCIVYCASDRLYIHCIIGYLEDASQRRAPENEQASQHNGRKHYTLSHFFNRKPRGMRLREIYKALLETYAPLEELIVFHQNLIENYSLRETELALVKEHFTQRFSEQSSAGNACQVCLAPFKENDEVCSVGCIHSLHYACLIDWCKVKPTCPICKYSYRISLMRK